MQLDELARLSRRDRAPRVPGDLQDHDGDEQTENRVADRRTKRDHDRACDDAERDEPVDAGVVAVGDQRGARQALPRPQRTCAASSLPTKPTSPAAASSEM